MTHLALAILLSNYKGITAILTPQISLCYWLYHFSISHSALAITRCYYGAVTTISSLLTVNSDTAN